MDYVVYGTGYGATMMLLGYALRTWGGGWRFANQDEDAYDRSEFRSARAAWLRFTNGLGTTIATCGAALVLLTFILMLVNPGDDTSGAVMLGFSGLLLVGVAAWAWLYFDRYGTWGVLATPEALSSYGPLQYDAQEDVPSTIGTDAVEDDDDALRDEALAEDDVEALEHDDEGEFAARYAKYQTHHPDGEEVEPGDAGEAASDDEDQDVTVVAAAVDVDNEPEDADTVDGEDIVPIEDDAASVTSDPDTGTALEDGAGDAEVTTGTLTAEDNVTTEDDIENAGVIVQSDASVDGVPQTRIEDDFGQSGEAPEEQESGDVTVDVVTASADSVVDDGVRGGGRDEALRRLRERRDQRGDRTNDDE